MHHPAEKSRTRMKTHSILFTATLFCCAVVLGDDFRELSRVHTVYIVGMSNGLDQFLASRLTSSDVLWVVLDPAKADAVLTDKLDEAFWGWLNSRFPARESSGKDDLRSRNVSRPAGAIRGTVFLIDPKSSLVLWSTYDQVNRASPAELDQAALRITSRLKTGLHKK
jgi:hypothetical protein